MGRYLIAAIVVAAGLLTFAAPSEAWHHRGHHGPYWHEPFWPYPYGYPYPHAYPYPPVIVPQQPIVVQPQQPQTYIQQQPQTPAPAQENYWYYCGESKAYYPHVQQCAGPWMKVVPQTTPPGVPR